jgi:hypothetical protein
MRDAVSARRNKAFAGALYAAEQVAGGYNGPMAAGTPRGTTSWSPFLTQFLPAAAAATAGAARRKWPSTTAPVTEAAASYATSVKTRANGRWLHR